MEKLKDKIVYGTLGASSGLVGLASFPRCSASTCTSCFGCAGAGIGIVLIALFHMVKEKKFTTNELDPN